MEDVVQNMDSYEKKTIKLLRLNDQCLFSFLVTTVSDGRSSKYTIHTDLLFSRMVAITVVVVIIVVVLLSTRIIIQGSLMNASTTEAYSYLHIS